MIITEKTKYEIGEEVYAQDGKVLKKGKVERILIQKSMEESRISYQLEGSYRCYYESDVFKSKEEFFDSFGVEE